GFPERSKQLDGSDRVRRPRRQIPGGCVETERRQFDRDDRAGTIPEEAQDLEAVTARNSGVRRMRISAFERSSVRAAASALRGLESRLRRGARPTATAIDSGDGQREIEDRGIDED